MLSNLITKENSQYRLGSPLLLLFSAPFIVWQMGVLYFSGTALSLFGRTPIPLTREGAAYVIAAGYLCSILMLCLFPRRAVLMERVLLPAALAASILTLFPLPARAVAGLFYAAAFCCVFSIGTMASIAAQHFTLETTWRDGLISMALGGALIAILQNDLYRIGFTAFAVASVALTAAQTVFYFLIPAKIEVKYAKRGEKYPLPLFFGIWLISGFSTLLLCFASSFAESVKGGVSVVYLSAAILTLPLFLKKRARVGAARVFVGFFALSAFGFVLAFLSLYLPALRLVACVFLGFAVLLANLWLFFAAASFQAYPTRFVGVIGAALGLALALFHSGVQEALRENIPLLYGIYAALSVALLLICFFFEPYFTRLREKERAPAAAEPNPAPSESHPFDVLSEQERILAGLILDGHTEGSAAKAMNISLNTQKSYRKNIYLKLDIHSKRELFAIAQGKGRG